MYRIHLDVTSNSLKLGRIANQSIIAFVLPERLPGEAWFPIALPGSKTLERLHQPGNLHPRSDQEMDMVPQDDILVEIIVFQALISIVNRFHHHIRDFREAKVLWAGTSVVENAIHRKERLSGGGGRRKTAIRRKATLQAPGEEEGLADGMIVRQAAGVKGGHEWRVGAREKNSQGNQEAD